MRAVLVFFTLAVPSDPGNLDPQMGAGATLLTVSQFAYYSLLSIDAEGVIGSALASDWSVDGTTVELTLTDGVTCADGTPLLTYAVP